MKTCCDEYCANHGCYQGRYCPARKTAHSDLPITMEDEQPSIFELICDFAVAGIFAAGTVTTALVAMWLMWRWSV